MSHQLRICLLFLTMLIYGRTKAQTITSNIILQAIEKNEKVLGLDDTTLMNETKQIRVFILSGTPLDSTIQMSIDPLNGFSSLLYKQKYNVDVIPDGKFVADINTGRYRDIFVLQFQAKNDSFKLFTLAFKFKPTDCLNQNKILGEIEFVKIKNKYVVTSSHLEAVD